MDYKTRITGIFFLICLIISANLIACQQKIADFRIANKLILGEVKSEGDILKEKHEKEEEILKEVTTNNLNASQLNITQSEAGVIYERGSSEFEDDPNDVLEEDWEMYRDPRVKHDVPLRKFYRSLKRQFDNRQFNLKTALVQLHNFERMRALQDKPGKAWKKKVENIDMASDAVETISECFSAFTESMTKDFCYRAKKSHAPNICQCGYRYYNGACYNDCRKDYLFTKGICKHLSNGDVYVPKYIDQKTNSVFECKYGFRKSNGYCYEDCSTYNMVNCFLFFAPGCASDTATCVNVNINAAFSVVMGVLQIVSGIITLGNGGGLSKVITAIGDKGFVKGIYESAKKSAKKAWKTLADPQKRKDFFIDLGKKTIGKLACKTLAPMLLKKTAEGPQDLPPEPSFADKVFKSPFVEAVTGAIPGVNLVGPVMGVNKDCSGDSVNPLNCAKAIMNLVATTDPTGILGGALTMAQAFMHPICDSEDEKLDNPDKDEQED